MPVEPEPSELAHRIDRAPARPRIAVNQHAQLVGQTGPHIELQRGGMSSPVTPSPVRRRPCGLLRQAVVDRRNRLVGAEDMVAGNKPLGWSRLPA